MRGTLANACMKGRGVACRGYSANSSLQRPRPYNLVMKPVMTVRPALILEELFTGIADNVFRPYVTIGLQVTCASLCLPCFSCWALLSVVCLVHTGNCICEFLGPSPIPYPVAPVCLFTCRCCRRSCHLSPSDPLCTLTLCLFPPCVTLSGGSARASAAMDRHPG